MEIKTETLRGISHKEGASCQDETGTYICVRHHIVETGRWDIYYQVIIEHNGHFYAHCFREGATEQQDYSDWDNYGDFVECNEVWPVQKTITEYVAKEPK